MLYYIDFYTLKMHYNLIECHILFGYQCIRKRTTHFLMQKLEHQTEHPIKLSFYEQESIYLFYCDFPFS